MALYLLSNMFPSERNSMYGIFVKRFEEAVEGEFNVKRVVLTKRVGFVSKLFGYLILFVRVIKLYFFVNIGDIIYVHFPLYFSFFLYPFVWKKIPMVLNFHGSDAVFDSKFKRFLFKALRPVVRRCQKIVVPSVDYRNRIGELFEVSERKIFVYPSGGIDSHIFYAKGRPPSVFTVGFVSNFIEQKGWMVFLQALEIINNSGKIKKFNAIMVGRGPDKRNILEQVGDKNLNVQIIDSVLQQELVNVYNSLSVFVFPTYRESLGLVGLEAMMCGIPVIASAVEGPKGYVREGYNGLFFEKGNSADLADKIMEYHALSQAEVNNMKQNCVVTALDYETRRVKEGMLNLLHEI